MRRLLLLLLTIFIAAHAMAQSKPAEKPLPLDPTKMTPEEMQRLSKMSPAELAAWKEKALKQAEDKLKKNAQAINMKVDETVLPTTQLVPPVKDLARISTIPAAPPTRQQLVAQTKKMEEALCTAVAPQVVQQVEEFSATKSVAEIRSATVGGWYGDNAQGALLLGMKAVQKDPSDMLAWNNLAALLSMAGMEHQAIPILQRCLQEMPDNSFLLNNLGQAWLGLGDLAKAKEYLSKCLAIDELHPEANRSMALLALFAKDNEKALQYFQKELEVAHRRSTLAQLVRSGHRDRINLAALRKRKMAHDGLNNRDFFEEINLGKFNLPAPPLKAEKSAAWNASIAGLRESMVEEARFWREAAQPTAEQLKAEGRLHPGIYFDLVNELIADLGNHYSGLIGIVRKGDDAHLTELWNQYTAKDIATKCPDPPHDPENAAVLHEVYAQKCCNLKTPLVDELMQKYNTFMQARIAEAQSNYKQYINGLVSIAQLNPSESNKRLIYSTVSDYFNFLISALNSYQALPLPMNCKSGPTPPNSDDKIKSARRADLKCPSWMKMNIPLQVVTLKADCNEFNVEAGFYKTFHAGVTKQFKTGTSTLYVGAGLEGRWKEVSHGSIKQQFYVVFDHNNQFADVGMRGEVSGDLVYGAFGAEAKYDFAMNAGFNAQGKIKSDWVSKYEEKLKMVTGK